MTTLRHWPKNVWGHGIPTPQYSILANSSVCPLRKHVTQYLHAVLTLWGLNDEQVKIFIELALREATKNRDDVPSFEKQLKAHLIGQCLRLGAKDAALSQRAQTVYREVKPYLIGSSLLDIGCGDGRITTLVANNNPEFRQIHLTDVVDYVPQELKPFFAIYKEGSLFPTGEQSFDTVLLLTVLHHATDPVDLLELAWQVTSRRLVIIESVVGVETDELTEEDQIAFAAFVDWFYNRVLHDGVPVPYNFTTVRRWQSTFAEHDMPLIETKFLGRDIDVGPEYHILFVLEKKETLSPTPSPRQQTCSCPTATATTKR
jgi:SAM-dependent methyltransferase